MSVMNAVKCTIGSQTSRLIRKRTDRGRGSMSVANVERLSSASLTSMHMKEHPVKTVIHWMPIIAPPLPPPQASTLA